MAAGQRLVAYERVSTARQGASGLGLEAQRKVIEDFAVSRGAEVLARFTEVESGRKAGVLTLPPRFLQWCGGLPGVFVVEKGRAAWRDVTLGLRGREAVEVIRGLSAGEDVVEPAEARQPPLTPGHRVRPA